MDILYMVGEGYSKCNYNELKYSLRSIEKYGKNVDRVFVAGYCPHFLNDKVIKVPCPQIYFPHHNNTEKHINIIDTLLYVVDNTDIGDEFLVSMDDHFYIKEVDFNNYPIYSKIVRGDIYLDSKRDPIPKYGLFILNTRKFLESLNLPIYFFTLHRNMHVFRETINLCRGIFNKVIKEKLDCEPFVLMLNYRYNLKPFEFVPIVDVKIKDSTKWEKVDPKLTEVFSTSDFESDSRLNRLIQNLYPDKSKYEC